MDMFFSTSFFHDTESVEARAEARAAGEGKGYSGRKGDERTGLAMICHSRSVRRSSPAHYANSCGFRRIGLRIAVGRAAQFLRARKIDSGTQDKAPTIRRTGISLTRAPNVRDGCLAPHGSRIPGPRIGVHRWEPRSGSKKRNSE